MNDDSCDTLSGPAQTDGYVYTVCVSSNPQYRGSGENPASLYRHKIDCWTPRRVFVMKRQEGVGDNRATKWAREQEGRWALQDRNGRGRAGGRIAAGAGVFENRSGLSRERRADVTGGRHKRSPDRAGVHPVRHEVNKLGRPPQVERRRLDRCGTPTGRRGRPERLRPAPDPAVGARRGRCRAPCSGETEAPCTQPPPGCRSHRERHWKRFHKREYILGLNVRIT